MAVHATRVLLVSDAAPDDRHIGAVVDALESAGFSVRLSASEDSPGEMAARYRPDVAVVSLTGERGPGADRQAVVVVDALARDHGVPVVVVDSGFGAAIPPGGDRGAAPADGITVVDDDAPVVTRLTSVLRGRYAGESSTLEAGDIVIDEAGRLALRADEPLDLTRLEFDLLVYFVRHRNRVLNRTALLAAVWHNEPVTPNAIEALVSKLRAKLEAEGPRVIHTVRGVGYVLRVEGTSPFDVRKHRLQAQRERLVRERDVAVAKRNQLRRLRLAQDAGTIAGWDLEPG
jgi:two-component system OmpR family response regulator